ncbi:hypothetical protein E2C01_095836 [Portunus trituberculatus]|uniref:Uncharacterized protein n=1 Tax=Portunus trituberculatus TaxID=210409 RepID=A0A5B7K034_PORTR|nr:hypothetical protein [Portunus trituberculatus]
MSGCDYYSSWGRHLKMIAACTSMDVDTVTDQGSTKRPKESEVNTEVIYSIPPTKCCVLRGIKIGRKGKAQ